jgi:hypothetical protein
MHALDLPRRYRTILLCDSFGLAGSREDDLQTLRRCHAHLEPGGALIVNVEAEYALPDMWALWVAENRTTLPQPWPAEARRRTAPDGSQHAARFRILDLDPLAQTITREVWLEKWVDGELAAEQQYVLTGQMYFRNELEWMLCLAGFEQIRVCGDYRDETATAEHKQLVFLAIK